MELLRDGRFLPILVAFAMPTWAAAQNQTAPLAPSWRPLFDGQSLAGWKETNFGGEGETTVVDGTLILNFGSPLTGVTYQGTFPKSNYEIRFDAMRVDGRDFFCGLTFPVGTSFCSLIVGGWGGALVGLSSIDGKDASENDTTKFLKLDNGRWYHFRLRVTPQQLSAWMDDQPLVEQRIEGRKISTRSEVDLSQPLGFAAYETKAALRKIEYRVLDGAPPAKD